MKFDDIIKLVEENPYSAFFYTPLIYDKCFSYIFLNPKEVIPVYDKNDVESSFRLIEKYLNKGLTGYCLLDYEAGYLFEQKLEEFLPQDKPKLMQFFFFDKKDVKKIKAGKIDFPELDTDAYSVSSFKLNTTKQQFNQAIKKIKHYIKEGDTYQVNYTVKGKFRFSGSYSALFQSLLFNQSARYAAFINNGGNFIVSVSPELFFEMKNRKIKTKPMKGTIGRGIEKKTDSLKALDLQYSEKEKAENVMIVDLLRNDLGRICKFGSVKVTELFGIEKYESLFQMVSTVEGKLKKDITLTDVIKNIFPCGSVTGAPKIRTMRIIKEVEKEERGIYTGSIGMFNERRSVFNVAIRTIKIDKENGRGEVGLGSGIVWDSKPEKEYREVLLKSEFLTSKTKPFELIETMLIDNGKVSILNEHIERLKNSAGFFLFALDEKKITEAVLKTVEDEYTGGKYKLRLTLNKWGRFKLQVNELEPLPDTIKVIISNEKISTKNRYQYFKTTNRRLYDEERNKFSAQGFFEVIFFNEREELAEGSITNVFIRKGDVWFTPPLSSGILSGVYRNYFITTHNNVKETAITLEDLLNADELLLVNSVRGEIKVNRFYYSNEFIEFP